MITSTRNPKIQMVRSLNAHANARREVGAFVIEGVRLVEESFAYGWLPRLVFYSEAINQRGMQLVRHYQEGGIQVEQVTPHVLKAAGDTETPQGILAVLPFKQLPLPPEPGFLLILDGIRDPGNLGTILRTAAAAGVEAVLLSPGSADAFAPKVLRSGMGAHFHLPIHSLAWEEIIAYLRPVESKTELKIYLADVAGDLVYTDVDMRSPLALIVGGEAEGAGEQAHSIAQKRVKIPMVGKSESLNAAVAAGILLFEAMRQRLS
jgi:RNA methyltransferase, TrmH family